MDSFAVACLNKAICICVIVIDICAIHALTINLLFGKTGFIFHLRGTDSQKVLDNNVYFSDDGQNFVLVKSAALVETQVFVYNDYPHVGSIARDKANHKMEIANRCNACGDAKRDVSRICKSFKIASKAKLHLSHTFGRSTLFYNIVSIPFWPKQSLMRFNNSYANLYTAPCMKRSESNEFVEHISDVRVFKRHSLAMCDQMLCIYRLKYLKRTILHAPPPLKQMLAYEWSIMDPLSWTILLVSDLRRLRATCAFLLHLPDPIEDPVAWHEFIVNRNVHFT